MSPTLNAEEPEDQCDNLKRRNHERRIENTSNKQEKKKTFLPELRLQKYQSLLEDFQCLFLDYDTLHMCPGHSKITKEWVFVNRWSMRKPNQQAQIQAGDIGMYLVFLKLLSAKVYKEYRKCPFHSV